MRVPTDGLHDLHINYAEDAIAAEQLRITCTSKRLEQALRGRAQMHHADQTGQI